ncbi:MAG: hypothetical protein IJS50_05870, partial [Desulfovibrio sp.]|nr:hypothetical protein [Desulfovibrio sp.]
MFKPINKAKARPSLSEEIKELDQEILHLLLKRFNLRERLSQARGHVLAAEEKEIRTSFENEARKVSSDPKLNQLFTLFGELKFYPKPTGKEATPTTTRKEFNLAPPKKPIELTLPAPASRWHTLAWLTLLAFQGGSQSLENCPLHDGQYALNRILSDFGCQCQTRESHQETMVARPLSCEDYSLHLSSDLDLFGLWAGQYLVRPSRVRFTAEGSLKLKNLLGLARFVPKLGARLTFAVPKSTGFPLRLECTGDLPREIVIPAKLPTAIITGLALALPFAEHSVTLNLTEHEERETILERVLNFLETIDAQAAEKGPNLLEVNPSALRLTPQPMLPMDSTIGAFLLAMPLLACGEVTLEGVWPKESQAKDLLACLQNLGLKLTEKPTSISAKLNKLPDDLNFEALSHLAQLNLPLWSAIMAGLAFKGHKLPLPKELDVQAQDFFRTLRLNFGEQGLSAKQEETGPIQWNAPSATWAMAYALAALVRPKEGFKLGNPGVITEIWPKFWSIYNRLQGPRPEDLKKSSQDQVTRRRFIAPTPIKLTEEQEDISKAPEAEQNQED